MKQIIVVMALMLLFCGCDKWYEVKSFNAVMTANQWLSGDFERTVIVIIEQNQDGEKRAYALCANGNKIDIHMRHAERLVKDLESER